MEGKKCNWCGEFKQYTDFYKNRYSKCKDCIKKYYNENAELIKQKQNERRKENNELIKQRQREYDRKNVKKKKEYYQENIKKIKQRTKDFYEKNSEKLKRLQKEYYKKNRERIKQRNRIYQKSKKGREVLYRGMLKRRSYKQKVSFTPHERTQILDRDNWSCQSCGCKVHDRHKGNWNTPDKAHIDHIIPVSKGGNSEPSNLQILCRTCNLSKSDNIEKQLELVF